MHTWLSARSCGIKLMRLLISAVSSSDRRGDSPRSAAAVTTGLLLLLLLLLLPLWGTKVLMAMAMPPPSCSPSPPARGLFPSLLLLEVSTDGSRSFCSGMIAKGCGSRILVNLSGTGVRVGVDGGSVSAASSQQQQHCCPLSLVPEDAQNASFRFWDVKGILPGFFPAKRSVLRLPPCFMDTHDAPHSTSFHAPPTTIRAT